MVPAIATPGHSGLWDILVDSYPQITATSTFLALLTACKFSSF